MKQLKVSTSSAANSAVVFANAIRTGIAYVKDRSVTISFTLLELLYLFYK